jgi:hypothetical protein
MYVLLNESLVTRLREAIKQEAAARIAKADVWDISRELSPTREMVLTHHRLVRAKQKHEAAELALLEAALTAKRKEAP